jgi:hypothetical protein
VLRQSPSAARFSKDSEAEVVRDKQLATANQTKGAIVVDCNGKVLLLKAVERRDLYNYVSMNISGLHQPDLAATRAKTRP